MHWLHLNECKYTLAYTRHGEENEFDSAKKGREALWVKMRWKGGLKEGKEKTQGDNGVKKIL